MIDKSKKVLMRGDSRLTVQVGFWYILATFLTKGVAFITTPIFSRIMDKSDYGEFSNYANWQAMILILVSAELYYSLSRAYFDYKKEYDQFISSVTIGSCLLISFFYVLFLLFGRYINRFIDIPLQYIHFMFFTIMCIACQSIFLNRERTLYRYKTVIFISVTGSIIPLVTSVILVWLMESHLKLAARIYGFYFPYSLIGFTCGVILIVRGRTFRWNHILYALKISVPMLFNDLTVYMLTSANVIITKSVSGAEKSAVVSISVSVIHIMTALFQALNGALTIWIMDNLEQKNYAKLRKELLIFVMGISGFALCVILIAPEIVYVLGGEKYLEAVGLIPFQVLAVLIQSMMTIFTIILTYAKNIKITAISASIVGMIGILAKIWLLPLFSLRILSVINAVAFAVLFIINYILVKKTGYSEVINIKVFCSLIVLVGFVCSTCFFVFSNLIIRYAFIAVIGICIVIFAVKNKQLIISILKGRKKNK